VPPSALRQVVSEACVRAMAEGARQRTGADVAIATTGIAGPTGGTRALPIGTVYVAAATADGTRVERLHLSGTRARVQHRAAAAALGLAWQMLHHPASEPR
jgi:PncC family amidohydrolase